MGRLSSPAIETSSLTRTFGKVRTAAARSGRARPRQDHRRGDKRAPGVFGFGLAFIRVNPVTHLSTAERGLMHGSFPSGQIWLSLLATACIVVVFARLTSYLYRGKH